MPFVSPNAGPGGSMVVAVKRHPVKSMAFVAFVSPDKAQAILASPPAFLCGIPVLPVRPHASDPNSIVVKWSDGASIQEEDIAAEFDAMFVGVAREIMDNGAGIATGAGYMAEPMHGMDAHRSSSQMTMRPQSFTGVGAAVRKVTKHATKPLAFVAFHSVELAQTAVMTPSPVRFIGQAQIDPVTPHRSDPDTVVLFWRPGATISELDIAEYCETLAAGTVGGGPQVSMNPNWSADWPSAQNSSWSSDWSSYGKGKGKSIPSSSSGVQRQFVEGVKKHPSKSMAFVTFKLEEVTQAALMENTTLTAMGEVPLDPLVPHKEDPRTVVMYWHGDCSALDADMIANFFESFMSELFGFGLGGPRGDPMSGSVPPAQPMMPDHGTADAGTELSPEQILTRLDFSRPMILGVKKHPTKTMAFVNFQSSDLAMVALCDPDPPRIIGPASIEPIRPHHSDPSSIVVYWHPGPDVSAESVAKHYEVRLATLLGTNGPDVPSLEEMKTAVGMDPNQPFVARVKQSIPKKTAFVTFQSPEVAQAIAQDGAAASSIAGVKVDPLELHRADPTTLVLFWKIVPNLDMHVVQEHFEARAAQLLRDSLAPPGAMEMGSISVKPMSQAAGPMGGKGGKGYGGYGNAGYGNAGYGNAGYGSAGYKGEHGGYASSKGEHHGGSIMPAMGALGPPPGHLYNSPEGLSVRKHGTQPMAFIIFPSEAIVQAVLMDPPAAICGVPVLPARPHNTNPKAIVLRWMGNNDLPESSIAAGISEFIAPLMQANVEGVPMESFAQTAAPVEQEDPDAMRKRALEEMMGGPLDFANGAPLKRFREGPMG